MYFLKTLLPQNWGKMVAYTRLTTQYCNQILFVPHSQQYLACGTRYFVPHS